MTGKLKYLFVLFCIIPTFNSSYTKRSSKLTQFQEAVDAIYAVTVRLEALMGQNATSTPKNFLVSPLSAAIVVGQLMLGAEGDFQEELFNLLSLSPNAKPNNIARINTENGNTTEIIPHGLLHLQFGSLMRQFKRISENSSFTLEVSNAVFYNSPIVLNETFKRQITQFYTSDLIPVNFTTEPNVCQTVINEWGKSHTNGLIQSILSQPAPVSTSSIFANAIYFKGNWEMPFSNQLNIIAPFHTTKDTSTNVTFMQNYLEDILYVQSPKLKCKMISLPYEDNDLSLYIILPDDDHEHAYDIHKFSQSLKATDILDLVHEAKQQNVIVKIPKMSLSATLNLLEPLKKYRAYIKNSNGLRSVRRLSFTSRGFKDSLDDLEEKVDNFLKYKGTNNNTSTDNVASNLINNDKKQEVYLTKAAKGQNLAISDLLQEITFSINEKGTEAAAISAGIIDYIGGAKNFNVVRPFVFFLRHEETTATIFWGSIADPGQSNNEHKTSSKY